MFIWISMPKKIEVSKALAAIFVTLLLVGGGWRPAFAEGDGQCRDSAESSETQASSGGGGFGLAQAAESTGGTCDDRDEDYDDDQDDGGGGGTSGIFTSLREMGTGSKYDCGDLYSSNGASAGCDMSQALCNFSGEALGSEAVAVEVVEIDTIQSSEQLLGFDCRNIGGSTNNSPTDVETPAVVTVTVEDFARMPVEPLVPNAGPPNGWVPVNMVNVLYVEPEAQVLDVELLDTPVQVRATPVSYHWDLGDGNTITTSKPGKPYPSEEVASEYTYEGWYDITLTTTFRGEFSVDGGEWQAIEGTIEVASDPVGIFAKSFESRLVDGDVPVDEEEDPWVPERSPETEGPQDPEARHREI